MLGSTGRNRPYRGGSLVAVRRNSALRQRSVAAFLAQAKLEEVEAEFRAQIETVLAAKLTPTHLDWHCLHVGGRPDIFDTTLGLAKEYGLALRVYERTLVDKLQRLGLPTDDHNLLDSDRLDAATQPHGG